MEIHTGKKPFGCDVCPKRFLRKSDLVTHMRRHTGEKPFICGCGKRFVQKCDLNAHMKTHSVEKPFTCNDCGLQLKTKLTFKRHGPRCSKKLLSAVSIHQFVTSPSSASGAASHPPDYDPTSSMPAPLARGHASENDAMDAGTAPHLGLTVELPPLDPDDDPMDATSPAVFSDNPTTLLLSSPSLVLDDDDEKFSAPAAAAAVRASVPAHDVFVDTTDYTNIAQNYPHIHAIHTRDPYSPAANLGPPGPGFRDSFVTDDRDNYKHPGSLWYEQ